MKMIYICSTYYHLLITIIKALKTNEKVDLLIANNWTDNNLLENKDLLQRLIDSKIFNNIDTIDFFEDSNIINSKDISYFQKYKILMKNSKRISSYLSKYSQIYLFNDVSIIGEIININNIKYNLIEDGVDCFKNNENIIHNTFSLKKIIKERLLKIYDMGESKNIKSIEVNDKNDIFIKNNNIIEKPKKELMSKINKSEQSIIKDIFIPKLNINFNKGVTVVITQPLFIDKIVKTEEEQIIIYKRIIDEYCKDEDIIFKVHPRDNVDYKLMGKKVKIIKEKFPIELFNYISNLYIDKIITISSTSINSLENCREKIILGWKWLNQQIGK